MTTYWCEHAQLPTKVQWGVRLTVDRDRITAISERTPAEPGDVRLPGVTFPGFANTHSHVFHRALRGRTHGGGGTFWTWREEMYAVAQLLDPDSYLALARAVFLEMVAAGFTAVGEFHYLHHAAGGQRYADPNAMGLALVQAAGEVGIRLTLLDTIYLHGGLTPQGHLPLDEVQQRFSDGDVDAWAARVADLDRVAAASDSLVIGAAAHSIRALTPRELDAFGEATVDRVLHAHVSEQPAENLAAQAFYGRTPTEILGNAGLLDEKFTAVHATHLSERDLECLEVSGAGVCLCPTTERDLADGVGPSRAMRQRGIPMSLGSDQHAVVDPFEEMRAVEMHERLLSHERGRFAPDQLVTMGSENGYRALGWEGGRLVVGGVADLVTVRRDSRRTAGSEPGQVLFAAGADDVTDVVVAGRHVLAGGVHALGDVDALVHEAQLLLRAGR
ncbi:MAG: formimidoylglutamate deiminase [Dermatophilaceae bacterium]|mgnify:FL=1